MLIIEPAQYAPEFLKKLVAEHNAAMGRDPLDFSAVVMARRYETISAERHPALRDRRPEFRMMLEGFGTLDYHLGEARYTGAELHEKFGFQPVGAQFACVYDILWIN